MILRYLFNGTMTMGEKLEYIIPQLIAALIIIFLVMPLHELAHAFVAYAFGDRTAKQAGRLTFNPIASISWSGALFILLFGFGWAKPVPVNPNNFKNRRIGMICTALAGPLSNLLMALIAAIAYVGIWIGTGYGAGSPWLYNGLLMFITINVALGVFNLLPVPPLDGSKVVASFLPVRLEQKFYQYQRYIVMAMFVLVMTGALGNPLYWLEDKMCDLILFLAKLPFQWAGAIA